MSAERKRKRGTAGAADVDVEGTPSLAVKASAACTACRKHKVKCNLASGKPPCSRCLRLSLSCVLHNPVRPGDVDARNDEAIRRDIQSLHSTLVHVCEGLGLQSPGPLHSQKSPSYPKRSPAANHVDISATELSPPASPSAVHAPIDTFRSESQPGGRRRHVEDEDLVSKRLLPKDTAEFLVGRYLSRFDHFLYGIANHYKSTDAIREASPALFAAICSVAALHDAENSTTFQVCLQEFRRLVSSSVFEKRDTEYIRALCIGSFWLLGVSHILSSDAIRRAADVRLHRHFQKLSDPVATSTPEQTAEARDCVRLWYLLFVCDQHLSILHNRDCLTQSEREIIQNRDVFLEGELTTSRDVRIVSQVSLLQIMCQVRDAFGSERMEPLGKPLLVQFNHFSRELDQYHAKYWSRFEPDPDIGDFPSAGLNMHYQFARLYLGHYVFRGLKDSPVPLHFLPAAQTAYQAAMTIFNMILDVEVLRSNLVGVPHYFHVMISFAGHLLLEICVKHREELGMTVEEDLRKISAVIGHFIQMPTLPQHPLTKVTTGLMRRLSQCTASLGIESVMAGTPFGTLEEPYAGALDFDTNANTTQDAFASTFDGQSGGLAANDFSFPDFGNFAFLDVPIDFAF